ncbi:MAG: UDP-2,3-diacylglucosamine diphosphatase LpxI [Candidatus Omnitrophota bacterium]
MERIGLIAGNRKFPLLFCQEAKKNNLYIVAVAVKGETSLGINKLADKVYWVRLSDFSRIFAIFKGEGIKKVAMVGQISPHRLFSREVSFSPDIQQILRAIKDKRADTIFGAIADKLKEGGLDLLDSTLFVKSHLPSKGVLTAHNPDKVTWEDISFGFEAAKAIGALDIGQAVAIKDKAIVAVEAFEGTDKLILRSVKLAGAGITIVKTAKPKQDMRFDVPVVGLRTIKLLIKIRAKCLAIQADKTLFIDRDASLKLADKRGLTVVAV